MSFTPVIPLDGYAGWVLFKRTLPAQEKAFQANTMVKRETEAFRAKIGTVVDADDLISDRNLLKVSLGAFGLQEDLNAKAFVKKILSDGTTDNRALSNRLADKNYYNFSDAFGLDGTQVPKTLTKGFADQIISQYYARQFEAAVGEVNDTFRLALNAERELTALATKDTSDNAKWFTIMGSKPLRAVFEKALNLPSSLAQLDVDRQLQVFKSKAKSVFGNDSVAQFADSAKLEKLNQNFIIRNSISTATVSSAQNALNMLSALPRQSR